MLSGSAGLWEYPLLPPFSSAYGRRIGDRGGEGVRVAGRGVREPSASSGSMWAGMAGDGPSRRCSGSDGRWDLDVPAV